MDEKSTGKRKSGMGLKGPDELCVAAKHSVDGFWAALRGEKAFRTDLVVFVACVCVVAAIPGLTVCERAVMVYVVFFPLVAELVNTAIEKTIDRISPDYHRLSGLVKDIGSAVVLAAFVGAGICWAVILVGWAFRVFGK